MVPSEADTTSRRYLKLLSVVVASLVVLVPALAAPVHTDARRTAPPGERPPIAGDVGNGNPGLGTNGVNVSSSVTPLSPEDFGYGSMTVNGKTAEGERPVLVILMDWDDSRLRSYHTPEFYERLMGNLSEYYTENSKGKFTWELEGVLGPYTIQDDPKTD